jgi:hypothetical protein
MSGFPLEPSVASVASVASVDARLTAPLKLPATSTGHLTTQGGNTLDDGSGNVSLVGTLGVGGQATFTNQIVQPVDFPSAFLSAALTVPAATPTTIVSLSLGVGQWLIFGTVAWMPTNTAVVVAAWFSPGSATANWNTTTDISNTTALGGGETSTKPLAFMDISVAGTIELIGEASGSLTVTNTDGFGDANTATGIIAIKLG